MSKAEEIDIVSLLKIQVLNPFYHPSEFLTPGACEAAFSGSRFGFRGIRIVMDSDHPHRDDEG